MKTADKTIEFIQYRAAEGDLVELESGKTEVIVEKPVSLTVNGEVWLTFMCTPVDLEALAVGFLFNEGIITSSSEVASVHVCANADNVDVWLHHPVEQPSRWRRTSGCTGGLTSVEERQPAPTLNGACLAPEQVWALISELNQNQELYRRTGGVHTSALSDGERILLTADDIGRHNTLDKLTGRCLLEDIHPQRKVLITTGRISSEMLQKAARMGAAVVISRTSPSSLSIEMGQAWGITLIGYARRGRFNLYTHPERILAPAETAGAG
jgi:FdhD protein